MQDFTIAMRPGQPGTPDSRSRSTRTRADCAARYVSAMRVNPVAAEIIASRKAVSA